MDIVGQLLLQLALILVNAFFAATEIAVISLNEKKVKVRAEDGDKKALKMLKMIKEPTQFLSTIQVGITLAGFLGSAFAADNFAELISETVIDRFAISGAQASVIETLSLILVTLILSYFTLVLGELVPKRLAMKHKEKLAESVCSLISALAVLLRPIIALLTVSTNLLLKLFRVDPAEKEDAVSQEDIVLMLDAGGSEGSLDHNDIEYIKNVFKLDELTAEDIMTPHRNMESVSMTASKEEIFNIIKESSYSRIPVYDENTQSIVGILHTKQFLLNYFKENFKLEDTLSEPVFIPETAHLDVLLNKMQKEHIHMVIIVNEYGETSGLVTMEDILEELVGEIWDESDEAIETFTKITNNTYKVLASVSIEDFFEYFDITPDKEAESTTLNGWFTELIEDIPKVGDTASYENLKITVSKADEFMAQEFDVEVIKE